MIDPQASIELRLHAHSRAITDVNFSAHHPDVLATSAVDSYVHCWDLRSALRPAISFCDWFAGATQVKWNRQDSHILASSHDKFLRIWDDRKGAFPLRSIEAHATKIYGVDWNRIQTNTLATCSLDKTIKLWDYASESEVPERIFHTPFPVWRARHTPFGSGLLAMPQRGNNDLHLFDRRPDKTPEQPNDMPLVHRFEGHDGQVKEFLWRPRGSVQNSIDDREFQLVSWGTDRVLRLHRLDDEILGKVGYVRGEEVKRTIPFTRRNAVYKSFRDYHARSEGSWPSEPESTVGMRGPIDLGMNRESNGLGSGWAVSGAPSISMAGKKAAKSKDGDAIAWMRGVKIGKRDAVPPVMPGSLSSVLSPSLKTDHIWDTFDSLADEITHVADLFGKVTFEDVSLIIVLPLSLPRCFNRGLGSREMLLVASCLADIR